MTAYAFVGLAWCTGCGTTQTFTATEQLLMSDAVDATIAKMDFTALAARKVYLDSNFVNKPSFSGQSLIIDANYMLSALRQQMVADGVLLVDKMEDADIVAEPRIGALGIDGHDIIYGIPASNALSGVSAAVSGSTLLPSIPEIAFARREDKLGAAKIAVFAYDRVSREPFWQSGIAQSNSNSKSSWVLGIGPFQRGSIYNGTQFAGERVFPSAQPQLAEEQQSIEQFASSQLFYHPGSSTEALPEVPDGSTQPLDQSATATSTPASDQPVAKTSGAASTNAVELVNHEELIATPPET